MPVIYKLTNLITQEIYIGQAVNFDKRMNLYSRLKCKNQRLLYASIKTTGWNNFKSEIIETCNNKTINERETFYIKHFNSYCKNSKYGLNLTSTGKASFRNKKHTEEWKRNASIRMKGVNLGKKLSKEHIAKIKKNHFCLGKSGSKHHRSIKVYQYDLNGNFIKEYGSYSEAARNIKTAPGNILYALKNKAAYCKGYYWCKEKLKNYYPENSKFIYQYDLNKCLIKKWRKLNDIEKELKINKKNLIWTIDSSKKKIYSGYIWSRKELSQTL